MHPIMDKDKLVVGNAYYLHLPGKSTQTVKVIHINKPLRGKEQYLVKNLRTERLIIVEDLKYFSETSFV